MPCSTSKMTFCVISFFFLFYVILFHPTGDTFHNLINSLFVCFLHEETYPVSLSNMSYYGSKKG